mgnify:CR=1 FL=1
MKKLLLTVGYIISGTILFAQNDTTTVQEQSISGLEQKRNRITELASEGEE